MKLLMILVPFLATFLGMKYLSRFLPQDQGRAFAVNGAKSKGKPRGAGIILISIFCICALALCPFSLENCIYLILLFLSMLSGFLDDASTIPWGELKKGLIDLVLSIILAVTFLHYNGNEIRLPFSNESLELPVVVYGILIVIFAWVSINVTNCADGVDSLCASLCVITLVSTYLIMDRYEVAADTKKLVVVLLMCILGYLWFNSSPSYLLMGDAGSRALGFFITIAFLKSTSPLLYFLCGLVLIIDGGLGLFKLTIIRVTKNKNFMKSLRTPIHDHLRKNKEWSDTQVVIRLCIIQIVIVLAVIAGLSM